MQINILIVEDKDVNRQLLRAALSSKNFNLIEAVNGQEAIDICIEKLPDLILMDIMMPGINGFQATAFIKNIRSDIYIPIIYVTALSAENAMTEALEAGGDDFVTKPVNFEILESKIAAHLRIRDESIKLAELNKVLESHNRRLTAEHEVIEGIMDNALSMSYLEPERIKFHISPCSVFNGDVLLVGQKPDGSICVFLGDFTGHGLPAAMGTLPLVQVFFTMVNKGLDLRLIVGEINRTLKMLLPMNIFCCANVVELDSEKASLSAWAGGLPDAILNNVATGGIRKIQSQHMPLGILSPDEFDDTLLVFDGVSDETLYMLTDGLIEARNAEGEGYGLERLESMMQTKNVFDSIIEDLQEFAHMDQHEDDTTLIEIKCGNINS
ncbi:MAG: fused response regulator/phosphatase [Gammaproteobacteria bacterium]|nr:fused response regulator/phosphatase [Gammaproteobacteria bacterium]